jgi:starch synthase
MKVLVAASEVVGFAKTGGLADVAGSLPRALAGRGHDCRVILPLYRSARSGSQPLEQTPLILTLTLGTKSITGRVWRSRLPSSDVPVYLVEQPDYFERDDPREGRGLYQFTLPNGQKRDYPDNSERFIFFSRAVLEIVRRLDWTPEIIHANDWQTGLIPVYLREEYRRLPGLEKVRSLFTVHNIAYQGVFWHWDLLLTGLDWRLFNYRQLEFHGHLNLLKAGIVFADAVSTVSPTYARETRTPYFGCGLHGVLIERQNDLYGIVNGVDYRSWDPAVDPHLAANYDGQTFEQGKPYHRALLELRRQHPTQIGVVIGFDEALAHQIEAGADLFLMPSLYEPSGLNQLYSMKYGTPPVVRFTGGLADTVVDCTPEALAAGTATGFTFLAIAADALADAVRRGINLYHGEASSWRRLLQTAMRQDWSWERVAGKYEKLYEKLSHGAPR